MAAFISRHDVEALAQLARLHLTDAEVESLRGDLTEVLAHMDALREVDTDGVEPMTHAVTEHQATRADMPSGSLSADVALAQAPARADDFFVVPGIIAADDPESGA